MIFLTLEINMRARKVPPPPPPFLYKVKGAAKFPPVIQGEIEMTQSPFHHRTWGASNRLQH